MPVDVVLEDGFPEVAAIDDVIDGARIFSRKFAGHVLARGTTRISATPPQ